MKIKRKLYSSSYYTEDEKLFYNPGTRLKRLGQKYIGRARRGIAEKLKESARKDRGLAKDIENYFIHTNSPNNHLPTEYKLIREAKNRGARVIGVLGKENIHSGNNVTFPKSSLQDIDTSKLIDKNEIRYFKKINNAIKDKRVEYIIQHPSMTGTDALAHEIGHVENSLSKNPIIKYISNKNKYGGIRERRGEIAKNIILPKRKINSSSKLINNNVEGNSEVVYNSPIKNLLHNKFIIQEEKNANKKALKLLKKNGMPKELIDNARFNFDLAEKSYKLSGKASLKESFAEKIQIPSRKRKTKI